MKSKELENGVNSQVDKRLYCLYV